MCKLTHKHKSTTCWLVEVQIIAPCMCRSSKFALDLVILIKVKWYRRICIPTDERLSILLQESQCKVEKLSSEEKDQVDRYVLSEGDLHKELTTDPL